MRLLARRRNCALRPATEDVHRDGQPDPDQEERFSIRAAAAQTGLQRPPVGETPDEPAEAGELPSIRRAEFREELEDGPDRPRRGAFEDEAAGQLEMLVAREH